MSPYYAHIFLYLSVPDRVGNLEFMDIRDTSVKVVWTPPASANGVLLGYTLTYMKVNASTSKISEQLGPEVLNYTITGLQATTAYTISVLARTRKGPGQAVSSNMESGLQPGQNLQTLHSFVLKFG